jgi:DinB family protein
VDFKLMWGEQPSAVRRADYTIVDAVLGRTTNMPDLPCNVAAVLTSRYTANLARIQELSAPLSNEQFWTKPFPFGNSFGHLVLHLTGNLNYYIGAQIANTGYVRDRPREFNDANPPSKEETLKRLGKTVEMVIATVRAQSPEGWSKPYSAMGTECDTRLDMVVQCAAHMQHHIGQMIYLGYEWRRQSGNQATK